MDNVFTISKSQLVFEIDPTQSLKAIDSLKIKNMDANSNVGFKLKSTNIARYVVSPVVGIIEPLQTASIGIMLTLTPGDKLATIEDKFRLYLAVLEDTAVDKNSVDKFIRDNEKIVKKLSLTVMVKDISKKEIKDNSGAATPFDKIDEITKEVSRVESRGSRLGRSRKQSAAIEREKLNETAGPKDELHQLREENKALAASLEDAQRAIQYYIDGESARKKFHMWKVLLILLLVTIVGAFLLGTERHEYVIKEPVF